MPTRTEIVARLKSMLKTDLFVDTPLDHLGEQEGLQSTVGLDSVSFIELRILCEQEYNIEISDDEFSPVNFQSLGALADFLLTKTRT